MVLIINNDKKVIKSIREMLYYMGIVSYGTNIRDAFVENPMEYSAVVLFEPDMIDLSAEYVLRLRDFFARLPICAISKGSVTDPDRYDLVFQNGIYSSSLNKLIKKLSNSFTPRPVGWYMGAFINAKYDNRDVSFFDYTIKFTKTEKMIIRYLIRAYPMPKSAHDILKYAFRPGCLPEAASVRTHISLMNKKVRDRLNKLFITSKDSDGYVLATPEIMQRFKAEDPSPVSVDI